MTNAVRSQGENLISPQLLDRLACPRCHGALAQWDSGLRCGICASEYPPEDGIVDFRVVASRSGAEDWTDHWAEGRQSRRIQRFFSWYRKVVFSRAVQHYCDRYFAERGVFLEAGSGTSETSMRLNKFGGSRILVALDIVPSVLKRCHPIMDVRLAGDIFQLPFANSSLDGLWNVGVMEHFTESEIDLILSEFRRVLRPQAPMVLFWPGVDSIPQKLLALVQGAVHIAGRRDFRFHPPEISQLRSLRHGREILERNGFEVRHLAFGVRSLFAFKVLVGCPAGRASPLEALPRHMDGA
ncbi:MAG: methyltransferase domain-containing protein [Bryobacterales bacterium]|nr:methyltransferase domain-containing protein [Bryobacteraceae bacterium]MDW8355909.1 methyltransferase domain-containing protein [Bryobacterales bacterium]